MKHKFFRQNAIPQSSILHNISRAKTLFGFLLALSLGLKSLTVWAEPDLNALEQALFSSTYKQESTSHRLERLEQSVFGEVQPGTESTRAARLDTVLKNTILSRSAANPTTNPNASPSAPNSPMRQNEDPYTVSQPVKPDATDYPTVTALERQVFARDFIRDDVQIRLNRLERKVFGQPDLNSPLADRVDRLLSRYPNITTTTAPEVVNVSPAVQALPSDASQFRANQRDIYSKLDALEHHHFNGQSNPNALLTERLDRLELKAYGQTFQGQSIDNRVNRLLSPYETNNQIQKAPMNSTSPNAAPRNIQIGGGFSSNSSYSFSPEMRSMLPPDIQAQMNGASNGGNGTVVRSPGTVIIERQNMGNTGFQTYGNAPIQQYNYYSGPAGTMQSQTTTVIQPNGQQAVYSYGNATTPPANGLPNPAYIGDPAFLQGLNQLEIDVFKQVNIAEPVSVRLSRLESALLGQVSVGMPDQQRLETLEKTHRLQAVSKLLGQSKGAQMGRGAGSFILGVPLNGPSSMNPMGMPQPLPINPSVFGR